MGRILKTLLWASVLSMTMLAGCADDASSTDEDPDDVPGVKATKTTGGIRGVVVDAAIVPIADATIKVMSTEQVVTSDANGAFVVDGLAAGSYFVEATHPLYDTQQASVDVVAGVEQPPVLKIQLTRVVLGDPYVDTLQFNGYIFCSANIGGGYSEECGEGVGVPRGSCFLFNHDDYAPCQENPVMPGERIAKNDNNHAGQEWYVGSEGAKTFIIEQFWEPSFELSANGGGKFLTFTGINWVCDPFCGDDHSFGATEMNSPLYKYVGPEAFVDLNYTADTRFTTFTYSADNPGLMLEQAYEQYVTVGYHLPIPEGWSFINNDPKPF